MDWLQRSNDINTVLYTCGIRSARFLLTLWFYYSFQITVFIMKSSHFQLVIVDKEDMLKNADSWYRSDSLIPGEWVFVFFHYIYECKQIIMQWLTWIFLCNRSLVILYQWLLRTSPGSEVSGTKANQKGIYCTVQLPLSSQRRETQVLCDVVSPCMGVYMISTLGEGWGKKFLYFLYGVYSIWYLQLH